MKQRFALAGDERMKGASTDLSISLPPLLCRHLVWSAVLTLIAAATKFVCTYVLRLPWVYDFYLFPKQFRLTDFYCFVPRFRDFHHATFFSHNLAHGMLFTYPAPNALAYEFFYRSGGLAVYVACGAAAVIWAAIAFVGGLQRAGLSRQTALLFVGLCALLSYPLLFNFYVGNSEIVVGVALGLGLYCFLTEKTWAAAVLLGIAASLKIYPLLFLVLFLKKKQYRALAVALCVFVFANLVGLKLMSGSIMTAWHGVQEGLKFYETNYALTVSGHDLGIDHSLFAEMKGLINMSSSPYPSLATMTVIMRVFLVVCGVSVLGIYAGRIRKLPMLNQVLCLCILVMLFSPGSKEYTLMNLYVPWGMLVFLAIEAWRQRRAIPGMVAALACCTLLFAPLNEFLVHGIVLSGPIKGVVLAVLLVVGLRYPFAGQKQPSVYAPA